MIETDKQVSVTTPQEALTILEEAWAYRKPEAAPSLAPDAAEYDLAA